MLFCTQPASLTACTDAQLGKVVKETAISPTLQYSCYEARMIVSQGAYRGKRQTWRVQEAHCPPLVPSGVAYKVGHHSLQRWMTQRAWKRFTLGHPGRRAKGLGSHNSPAQLRPRCSVMTAIFISARSVSLVKPGKTHWIAVSSPGRSQHG